MLNHLVAARGIGFNGSEIPERLEAGGETGDLELLNR